MKRSFSTMASNDEEPGTTREATPFSCIQMFRDIAMGEAKGKNFVFSPCSIQLATSLVANGAKGSTLQELLKFLGSNSSDQLKSHASKLISFLTGSNSNDRSGSSNGSDSSDGPELSFIGGVWVDQTMNLMKKFKTDAENIYKAKAESVDFKKNAKEIRNTVNQWAAESTDGLINSLLPQNSLNRSTRLVLANALYFKGKWASPFEENLTKEFDFKLQGGGSVKVPFMTNYERRWEIETFKNFKVLALPYKDSSLSMYIILPNTRDGLWPLVKKMGSDPLFLDQCTNPWMKSVPRGKFWIPKFKIDYEFEASEVLKAMGLELCYSDNAEFDNMVAGGGVKVGAVYHKSHIEVEEEGTIAAASTAFVMRTTEARSKPPPKVDFVADRPFMYIVRDDTSGMVLFMGHVLNPLC